jgi:hypothetical protein
MDYHTIGEAVTTVSAQMAGASSEHPLSRRVQSQGPCLPHIAGYAMPGSVGSST